MTSRWVINLFTIICSLLSAGCFVVTSNHVSKPVGPSQTVEFRHNEYASEASGWYVRHFHSPDLDFDLGLDNNTERLQVGFLFWVLPIPFSENRTNLQFEVEADFQPASGKTILIDPWLIEYIPANGAPVAPSKILRNEGAALKPVSPGPMLITNHDFLSLHYEAKCDPDVPFKLSVGGLPPSGQTNSATIIRYKRSKIVRAGFKLPY
jgi:hypothetical protein